jgi:hypothetical protein
MNYLAGHLADDQEEGHCRVPNALAHGPGEGSCKVDLWSEQCGETLILYSAVSYSTLRSNFST